LLSRRINGGNNGLVDRITKTKKYYEYVRWKGWKQPQYYYYHWQPYSRL
jgi:hypothetical protein